MSLNKARKLEKNPIFPQLEITLDDLEKKFKDEKKNKEKIQRNGRHDKKNQATSDDSNVKIQFQNRSQSSFQKSAHKVVQSKIPT